MKSVLFSLLLLLAAVFTHAQSANVQTVMDGYAKFGAGDIPGILNLLSSDIVWTHAGDPAVVPFAGTFHGQSEVGRFFELVAQSIQVDVFQPANYRESGNTVTNDCHIEGVARNTGKKYVDDLVMIWTFGPDGKAVTWTATGSMAGITAAMTK
ncbi:MAG TPA: nuclear transport factor 2 family protein [Saprospiraceae bacterium]|nr:nuclear transport factor 2 family protein [Saprospiraceae bacterium]HNM24208.1 nuclear transport factor 2 family protein [Saprospiraceae bacterium]